MTVEAATPIPTPRVAPLIIAVEATTPVPVKGDMPVSALSRPFAPFHGDTLIEQKILNNDIIVRATMTSLESEVVADADGKYSAVLKFSFNVSEYLKGAGPSSIVGVWVDGIPYDTHADAEGAKTHILSIRDSQWDDREAIIFLYDGASGFGTTLDAQFQYPDHFLLALGDRFSSDDRYSIRSETNKNWFPTASVSSASGESLTGGDTEYLIDVPSQNEGESGASSTSKTPTITLNAMKKRIAEVTDEFNGGDGSTAYKECVVDKYRSMQATRYFQEIKGQYTYGNTIVESSIASGLPANALLHDRQNYGYYPKQRAKTWMEGENAALFSVAQGQTTPYDIDGDGKFTDNVDGIEFTEIFKTTRPLPAGVYEVDRKEVWGTYLRCNYIRSFDWNVTVTAPIGAIHEAFFDPVRMTGGIGADKQNGVLNPTSFTVNETATNIERIEWKPHGMLEMDLKPGVNLSGHIIEFIGLNGKAFLSLSFSSSLGTSDRPSWQVCDQPWKAGDLLMIRLSAGASAFGKALPKTPCPQAATPTPTSKSKATPKPTAPPRRK